MGNFDFESGCRYMAEGDFVEAIRCFLASLDLDPGHTQTYVEFLRAYEQVWEESGDPDVLDQMRKVAIAGLKRQPTQQQLRFLDEVLDRVEEQILRSQQAEQQAERDAERREGIRRLPVIPSGPTGISRKRGC